MLLSMLFLTDNPLDGALGLIYFVCLLLLLLHQLRAALVLEVMHKSVLPKDIKMPTATLAYPQYTYQQMRWRGSIPGTS